MTPRPQRDSSNGGPAAEMDAVAKAIQIATQITTIALEMILPGVGGWYLDRRWGTRYWMALGFGLGLVAGFFHLIAISKQLATSSPGRSADSEVHESPKKSDEP